MSTPARRAALGLLLALCCLTLFMPAASLPALAGEPAPARENVSFYSNVITMDDVASAQWSPDAEDVHADITLIRSLEGDTATITAEIAVVPAGLPYELQWQNDLSGEFRVVPGETGHTIAFPATEENLRCMWRVSMTARP